MDDYAGIRLHTLGARRIFAGTQELFADDYMLQEQAIHILERCCLLGIHLHNNGNTITTMTLAKELWPEFRFKDARQFLMDVIGQVERALQEVYPALPYLLQICGGHIILNPEIDVSSDSLEFELALQQGIHGNNKGGLAYWTNLADSYDIYMQADEIFMDSPQILVRRKQLASAHRHVLSYVKIVMANPKTLILKPDSVCWEIVTSI